MPAALESEQPAQNYLG